MKVLRNIETGAEVHAADEHAKDLVKSGDFEAIEPVESADQDGSPNLSDLKKAQLVDLAAERGIEFDSKATKDELIAALEAADQDGSDE
jgi:hypothetical protein